jgi:hypothetical protein
MQTKPEWKDIRKFENGLIEIRESQVSAQRTGANLGHRLLLLSFLFVRFSFFSDG